MGTSIMSLAAPANRTALEDVLARARGDSVEFPYLLANHAPMALTALERLGAPPSRLEQWRQTYSRANGLVPMPAPVRPIEADAWREALGDRTREADWRAFFEDEVGRLGVDGTIRLWTPRFVQGVAGSATHPLMRLAYGLIAGDDAEVAVALGYWGACFLPLSGPTGAEPDTDDPAEVLAGVASIEGVRTYETETDLLWHNIRAVAALPGFHPVIDRLAFGPDTPRRLAATALALFVGTTDFAALHAVTGLHWARVVAPHIDEPERLHRAFWQVVASLVPKIGFPSLPSPEALDLLRRREAPPWPTIKAAAIASDDEHDLSLTFSCWQEERVWGDPLYRFAAARRLELIA
jgi:hypothetical protein